MGPDSIMNSKHTDKILDDLFNWVEDKISKDKKGIPAIEDLLNDTIKRFWLHTPTILIGILTATLPIKSKLSPSRPILFELTKRTYGEELVKGLE